MAVVFHVSTDYLVDMSDTKNSIEEKIQKLQEQKQDLSNMFIENNHGSITQMSTADIIDLFK